MESTRTRSAEIRVRLTHPIIDSDAHIAEFEPALIDYLRRTRNSDSRWHHHPLLPGTGSSVIVSRDEERSTHCDRIVCTTTLFSELTRNESLQAGTRGLLRKIT